MLLVDFKPPKNERWKKWRKKCAAAKQRVIKKYNRTGEVSISEGLYKELKKEIYVNGNAPFYGKCVYCEQKIGANQHGDMEHFRPKKKVTDENDVEIFVSATKTHPGYYWLAYDWKNLLPSCQLCNQPSTTSDKKALGKRNRFPVDGKRAAKPGEDSQENALLLNPLFDDPKEHLQLVEATGVLEALSPRGEMCIKVLGLNDRNLPVERMKVFKDVSQKISLMMADLSREMDVSEAILTLQNYLSGEEALSLAGQTAIQHQDEIFNGTISKFIGKLDVK